MGIKLGGGLTIGQHANIPHTTSMIADAAINGNKIAAGVITNTHVKDDAAIAESKLNLNYPTHAEDHASRHAAGGADEITLPLNAAAMVPVKIVASDDIVAEANTERTLSSESFGKVKEFRVYHTGTVRVKYELASSNGVYYAYGTIYINGVDVGPQHATTSSSWVAYSDDVAVKAGDYVSIYIKIQSISGGAYARLRNAKLCFTTQSTTGGDVIID